MLTIITGVSQVGKTRYLQQVVADELAGGRNVYGVITPGDWQEINGAFVKQGINVQLLPENKLYDFAKPKFADGLFCGWNINLEAVDMVNKHISHQALEAQEGNGLFVIDELGPLEFVKRKGFTSAMKLLNAGPTSWFQDAIIIVRESLLEQAIEEFGPGWNNDIKVITK